MLKFRLYFDKDEESRWLNEMSEKGWAMERFFAGFYRFERCEPGTWIYQIDFGEKLFRVSEEYREFMAETGVWIVQPWGYWIFLRKRACEGAFELYTDVDSKIDHYSKICELFKPAIILEIIVLFLELFAGMQGVLWGYTVACLIWAMTLVMTNAFLKTKDVIARLREQRGEAVPKNQRRISTALLGGLLLNSCALIIDGSVPEPVEMTVQIGAIVLMLVGVYRTAGRFKNDI